MSQPLFDSVELGDFLRKDVTESAAASAERVVWGWLSPVLGLTQRPDPPISDQLFSWAIELGAIAYENPTGDVTKQLGNLQVGSSSATRRAEILEAATSTYALAPRGTFPPAPTPAGW